MKIYTKRGDLGQTDLFGGGRVSKNSLRVKVFGDIDSANSAIGLAYSIVGSSNHLKELLEKIMKLLFCAGAEIATAPKDSAINLLKRDLKNHVSQKHIKWLEDNIDQIEGRLAPLKSFVLPTGSDTAARLHFARTVVRKAEISLVELKEAGSDVREEIVIFFNRLSDLLFVMARFANHENSFNDILWDGSLENA
ncbi:MAG: cob(I)yrinic acid a,c-diamide adenosyltransferase [Myxococcales bacterium]|nr:MAG: cob(I)yrinic acid a,c-diamide adenosyltransferase [Myxococcales bacterium]